MGTNDLAAVGALLGDGTRADMLGVLLDGRAHTVGELARQAGVAPSTASEHLGRLLDGGLVAVSAQGRHRYYRLAGPEVAAVLEAVDALDRPPAAHRVRAPSALAHARTCYDHLAGTLGVALHDRLAATGSLTATGPALSAAGEALVAGLGVDPAAVAAGGGRRPFVRTCIDWTERRPHLAGALGAAVLASLFDRRWLARGASSRAVTLTAAGRTGLGAVLGTVP
jgi:DNA-binding transcriptional ArsR family regulator